MRDITIRTTTSDDRKRRHLRMTELINDQGMVARAEKNYAFYITEKKDPIPDETLVNWIETQNEMHRKKSRHICVKRSFDQDSGLGQTIYRTTGSFYVVKKSKIYVVVFLHSVKFDILSPGPFNF